MNKIYAILDTQTNQFISFGPKISWAREGNAKNAFSLHMGIKFATQSQYKIVELTEAYFQLEGLQK